MWLLLSLHRTEESHSGDTTTESVGSPKEDSSKERQQDAIESVQERPDYAKLLKAILNSKIVFYGQVLDRNDEPVAGATVKFSMLGAKEFSQVWEGAGNYRYVDTDQNGRFEIRGKGGTLYASAYHDGYYRTAESGDSFTYGMPSGREPARDPANPAILRLHKKGQAEPLIFAPGRFKKMFDLRGDKNPAVIDLQTVNRVRKGGTWSNRQMVLRYLQNDDSEKREWTMEVSLKEGGVIERIGRFDFMAPQQGYQKRIVITSEEELEKGNGHARAGTEKHFFAEFPDGTYGRFVVGLFATDDPYFTLASWINPTGSRNLEYDPDKQIKVP